MSRTPLVLTFVTIAAAGLAAAEPTKEQLAAAEKRLAAFRKATSTPGVKVVSSLDGAKVAFAEEAKAFEDTSAGLAGLQTAAANLAKCAADKDPKKREAEARRFMKVLAEANPNSRIELADTLSRNIGATEFGVIAEATDTKFKLSAAELAKGAVIQPPLGNLTRAMTDHAKHLGAVSGDLDRIAARASGNGKALKAVADKIDVFVKNDGAKDVVNNDAVQKLFDVGLLKKYETLAAAAAAASKRTGEARTAQDALKKAVADNVKLLEEK
ncbi:hypothetical protein [Gemmata sp.]|uniref:hypothetical protein n=1 Tax=Gemmata sp. TaxID=1914242 RepID=UPI003F7018F9